MNLSDSRGAAFTFPEATRPEASRRRKKSPLGLSGVAREQELDCWMMLIRNKLGASMAELSLITGMSLPTIYRRFHAMQRRKDQLTHGS